MNQNYYVYILASRYSRILYIGVTRDIRKRVYIHKEMSEESFTKKYRVTRLVYFEEYDNVANAIIREKAMKKWNRSWKIRLIEKNNPNWNDLYINFD